MLVQDPTRGSDIDVDTIFNLVRHSAVEPRSSHHQPSSSSKAFTGTARLLTGEPVPSAPSQPSQPEEVVHNITFWRNGFTVDDGPLRRMDDPANASFLEVISFPSCTDFIFSHDLPISSLLKFPMQYQCLSACLLKFPMQYQGLCILKS